MYRIGKKHKRRTKRKIWRYVLALILFALAVSGFVAYKFLTTETESISTTKSITREYAAPQGEDIKEFAQSTFRMNLPADWVFKGSQNNVHNLYSYQSVKKHEEARTLEIYVDDVPADRALNRILPVTIEEGRIKVTGSVSDNCTEFTGLNNIDPLKTNESVIASKWQGVEFKCDVANRVLNAAGVGIVNQGTVIPITGESGVKRNYYFLYVDHTSNPDYSIFEDMLESFVAL